MHPDISNTIFQQAVAFISQTNQSLFLTGKAGTGKTTFLKYIRENCFKKMAVVAPTGVAAINAGGVTIHSFFQLPFGMYIPSRPSAWGDTDSNIYNTNQLLGKLRLNASKRDIIRELDLLIIDEVSMVRADLLDAVDTVLRSVRRRHHEPFGGVQMLYIGDLFQLPPVVTNAEWTHFQEAYNSPFFFDSKAIGEAPPVYLELKKIYRQQDAKFIGILNNVRNNTCTDEDFTRLHRYYQPDHFPSQEEGYITLTSHNYKADSINRERLAKLPGKTYRFEAEIKGDFSENAFPVSRELQLKTGAQIMFIKNDKGETRRYYNGKIGHIQRIEDKEKKIFISFPKESPLLELSLETWRNIRYKYDQEKDEIKEEELGIFKQYPVRLAWAVTIHKSQGLTFDKAIVDAGASFAAGQVYVALSRLTGLDGLILRSRITPRNILTNEQVVAFSNNEQPEHVLQEMLASAQQDFIRQSLLGAFDWKKLVEKTDELIQDGSRRSIPDKPNEIARLNQLKEAILNQYRVAEKFKMQLERLFQQQDKNGYVHLHARNEKAVNWFYHDLQKKCSDPLQENIKILKIKTRTKKYVSKLREMLLVLERKQEQIKKTLTVTEGLSRSLRTDELMNCVTAMQRPAENSLPEEPLQARKSEKGATRHISLELYREGISIDEIAVARNLTRGTIEGHLATFIPTGEVDIHALITPDKLEKITAILQSDPHARSSFIREELGNNYSFGEIKAAMLYWEKELHSENNDE